MASSLAGGLGLLIPVIVLLLAYVFGHVHSVLSLFIGFMTLAAFAGALPPAIRLGQTLRVGSLKVRGATAQRAKALRRFWTWVAVAAFWVVVKIAGTDFLAWVTLQCSA